MDSSNPDFFDFEDSHSELPEGFGWEDMKDGIYQKMERDRRRTFPWFWFGSAALLLATIAGLALFTRRNMASQIDNQPVAAHAPQQLHQQPPTQEGTPNSTVQLALEKVPATADTKPSFETASPNPAAPGERDNDAQASAKTGRASAKTGRASAKTNRASAKTHLASTEPNRILGTPATRMKAPTSGPTSVKTAEPTTSNPQPVGENQPSKSISNPDKGSETHVIAQTATAFDSPTAPRPSASASTLSMLPLHPLELLEIEADYLKSISFAAPEPAPVQDPMTFTPGFTLSTAGLVLATAGQQSDFNQKHLSSWIGSGAELGVQWQFMRNWSLGVNYQWANLSEQFSFQAVDTLQVGEIDRLTEHRDFNNLLLRSSTQRTEQLVERQREILSYNDFRVQSLQLTLYRHFHLGSRHDLMLGLGGGMQQVLSARGHRLQNDNELADLSALFAGRQSWSAQVGGRLVYSYQFLPKWQLQVGLGHTYSMRQQLPGQVGAGVPHRVHGSVGLALGLK